MRVGCPLSSLRGPDGSGAKSVCRPLWPCCNRVDGCSSQYGGCQACCLHPHHKLAPLRQSTEQAHLLCAQLAPTSGAVQPERHCFLNTALPQTRRPHQKLLPWTKLTPTKDGRLASYKCHFNNKIPLTLNHHAACHLLASLPLPCLLYILAHAPILPAGASFSCSSMALRIGLGNLCPLKSLSRLYASADALRQCTSSL